MGNLVEGLHEAFYEETLAALKGDRDVQNKLKLEREILYPQWKSSNRAHEVKSAKVFQMRAIVEHFGKDAQVLFLDNDDRHTTAIDTEAKLQHKPWQTWTYSSGESASEDEFNDLFAMDEFNDLFTTIDLFLGLELQPFPAPLPAPELREIKEPQIPDMSYEEISRIDRSLRRSPLA